MYASAYSSKTTSKETLDSFLDDNTLNFLKKTFGLELYLNKEEWKEAIEDDEYVDKEVLVKLKEGKDDKFYVHEVSYKPPYKELSGRKLTGEYEIKERYEIREYHKFNTLSQAVTYFLHKKPRDFSHLRNWYSRNLDPQEDLDSVLEKIASNIRYVEYGTRSYNVRKVPLIIEGKEGTKIYGIADISLLFFYWMYQDEKIHFKEKFTRTKFMNGMRTARAYAGKVKWKASYLWRNIKEGASDWWDDTKWKLSNWLDDIKWYIKWGAPRPIKMVFKYLPSILLLGAFISPFLYFSTGNREYMIMFLILSILWMCSIPISDLAKE